MVAEVVLELALTAEAYFSPTVDYSTFDINAYKTMFTGGNGGDGGRNNGLSGGSGGTGRYDYYAASNVVAYNAVKTGNGSVSITYTPVSPTATPVVDFKKDPAKYMVSIRDYDGNNLGGASSWKLLGDVDIQGDGDLESILVNPEIGRFASVGAVNGDIDFTKYGLNGDTRVVGTYIDPTLKNQPQNIGGPLDSQKRFQNDLKKDNLKLLAAGDYNKDGFQDMYFKLGDGSAVLRASMFKDGNIQYANYQSKSDLTTFMTANNVSSSVWSGWI